MRQKKVKEIRRLIRKANADKSLERRVRKLWYETPKNKRNSIIKTLELLSQTITDETKTVPTTNTE